MSLVNFKTKSQTYNFGLVSILRCTILSIFIYFLYACMYSKFKFPSLIYTVILLIEWHGNISMAFSMNMFWNKYPDFGPQRIHTCKKSFTTGEKVTEQTVEQMKAKQFLLLFFVQTRDNIIKEICISCVRISLKLTRRYIFYV